MEISTVVLVGFLVGAVLRTVVAYLQKYIETPDLKFDGRYLATMVVSMIASSMFGILAFGNVQVAQALQLLSTDLVYLALFATAIGYTSNDLTNRGFSITVKHKQKTMATS